MGEAAVVDIVRDIESRFDAFSPQLQVVARYILDASDDVALYSMREIATRAGVKPSTMVRLSEKLGFRTYNEFRDAFRKRISTPASGYAARARQLQLRCSTEAGDSLVSEIRQAERENVDHTFDGISDDYLDAAASALINSETKYVVGMRKCFPIAYFFHYATRVFFSNCRLVQGNAGLFQEEISDMTQADAVLAIAFEPYTRETVEAANLARQTGAKLIVVTDSVVSPLAKKADFIFIAANRSPSFYRSLTGALSVVQSLVAAIVTRIGEPAAQALELSDKRLRTNNTYWNS